MSTTPMEDDENRGMKRTIDDAEGRAPAVESDFKELLRLYYARLFPFQRMVQWLRYDDPIGKSDYFAKREMSFTLEGDIYLRYKSFANEKELRDEIMKLQPIKIDIGAVYSVRPNVSKTVQDTAFVPQEKELVFDIDMTDYDEVRTCCSGADVCKKCWRLMSVAIKVLNKSLREDFGFKHMFWVFSGRRGVHCWVADKRARSLSTEARAAVAESLNVISGGAEKAKKVNFFLPHERTRMQLHPMIQRALVEVVEPSFVAYLEEQEILEREDKRTQFLDLIPLESDRVALGNWLAKNEHRSAEQKWATVRNHLSGPEALKKLSQIEKKKNIAACWEIMFQYIYPRLDIEVSKQFHHLLKSPWVVHPKTGKVCVPIDPDQCDEFDPHAVPTLATLEREINEYDAEHGIDKQLSDYKKTSLKPYIEMWDRLFLEPLAQEMRAEKAAKMEGIQEQF